MSTKVLERALSDLQRRVADIEHRLEDRPRGGWEAVAGKAKDDDLFEEAMRLGSEWRDRANAEGR